MSGAREQVTRLLALVPYLQSHDDVPLKKVADDFGVSTAQIVKDLRVLYMCGLPGLYGGQMIDIDFEAFENDPDGVVRIGNADYLSRPLRLDGSEAAALTVALQALLEATPEEATREVVNRVLGKLEEANAGAQVPVGVVGGAVPRNAATVTLLEDAIAHDRQVRLTYFVPTRDETTTRVVDPLAVLERDGRAYLDAWCHLADDRRLFRVDRIDAAEPLDSPRAAPPVEPRDLAEGLFEPSSEDTVAVLRLRPTARWMADYYPVESSRELGEGALEVRLAVGDPRWLVKLVASQAPGARVVEPAEYAAMVTRSVRAALALYDNGVR